MTLATFDRITFYSSPDLKNWKKESEFGEKVRAHGGVWECPDLFPLKHDGKDIWILLVSINPGGPNGGSATQYFTGTVRWTHFYSTAYRYKMDRSWS
jgi:fructan beta-fructosidase